MPAKEQNIYAIEYALTHAQRYVYRSAERAERIGANSPDMAFERGKIDGLRTALFALGYSQAEIDQIQWSFNP